MADAHAILVSGSAAERGSAVGQAFGPAIHAHLDALLDSFHLRGSENPERYAREMVASTRYVDAVTKHMPHLLNEVYATADSAGCDRDLLYAVQLMDEEWFYRSGAPLEKCSSFAIVEHGSDTAWVGQNMDLGSYTDGFQRVVHHAPHEGPRMRLFTTAGMLALMGVNDAGVGVCVNSLPQLPSRREGIPVAFMIRRLLETRSGAEAADLCRSLPHATNQHYVIIDPGSVTSLEASAAGVTEYYPELPDRVLHTNHPLAYFELDESKEVNSVARLRSLQSRLGSGRPTVSQMQDALSAFDDPEHPVCRPHDPNSGIIGFTTGSMISKVARDPQQMESWVSFGPPHDRGFEHFGVI